MDLRKHVDERTTMTDDTDVFDTYSFDIDDDRHDDPAVPTTTPDSTGVGPDGSARYLHLDFGTAEGSSDRAGSASPNPDDADDPSEADVLYPLYIYVFGDDRVDELQDTLDAYRQQYVLASGLVLPAELEAVAPLSPREVAYCRRFAWLRDDRPTVEDIRLLRTNE
jgi:hypothetical protein